MKHVNDLARAIALDAANIDAWFQLAALVGSAEEQRFCLSRVQQLDPQHEAVRQRLAAMADNIRTRPPACATPAPDCCVFPGCGEAKTMASYCHAHWRAIYRRSALPTPAVVPAAEAEMLSASALAERLRVPTATLLAVCAELGWLERGELGWRATSAGQALGALQLQHSQSGVPYVHWPSTILDHPALPRTLRYTNAAPGAPAPQSERAMREQHQAILRTLDGHLVRTQAEVIIDNWLFNAGFVHAYERLLPTTIEMYCDFYLPAGRVYLEYGGGERSPAYREHATSKHALYTAHHLNHIALSDDHMTMLDACMPILLAQFGMKV